MPDALGPINAVCIWAKSINDIDKFYNFDKEYILLTSNTYFNWKIP